MSDFDRSRASDEEIKQLARMMWREAQILRGHRAALLMDIVRELMDTYKFNSAIPQLVQGVSEEEEFWPSKPE